MLQIRHIRLTAHRQTQAMGKALKKSSFDDLRHQNELMSEAVDDLRGVLESGASDAGLSNIEQHLRESRTFRSTLGMTLQDERPPVPKAGLQRISVALSRMATHVGVAAQAIAAAEDVPCRAAFAESCVLLVGALRLLDEAVEDLHHHGVESRATKELPSKIRPLIEAAQIISHDVTADLSLTSMEGVANKMCLHMAAERLSAAARVCGQTAELTAILVSDLSLSSASDQTITF